MGTSRRARPAAGLPTPAAAKAAASRASARGTRPAVSADEARQQPPDAPAADPLWCADHPSVQVERLPDSDGCWRVTMAAHTAQPFVRTVADADDPAALQAVADAYLAEVLPLLTDGLARTLAHLAAPATGLRLDWLPAPADGDGGEGQTARLPLGSADLRRRHSDGSEADRIVALLAAPSVGVQGTQRLLGGRIGVQVVLHVGPAQPQTTARRVRITRVVASGLHRLPLLGARASDAAQAVAAAETVSAQARTAFGLTQVAINTLVPAADTWAKAWDVAGTGLRRLADRETAVVWDARLTRVGTAWRLERGRVVEHAAHGGPAAPAATAGHRVFRADPASAEGPADALAARAPTRLDAELNAFRHPHPRLPTTGALSNPRFEVVGRGDAAPPLPAPAADPALVRSDDLAALHAHARGLELFERFDAYGLNAAAHLPLLRLPLRLVPRAVLADDPGGASVNARVRPLGPGVNVAPPALRPQLAVEFGAAESAHRQAPLRPNGATGAAQALGLAADPRWAWHEFAHVLIYGATGELEFPFAHSVGDALAALVAAPDSALGGDAARAGLTFPWSMLTRRHDRDADRGLCWCGANNRLRLAAPGTPLPRPHGSYAEEQMLSSSLYRAYLALGGATLEGVGNAAATPRGRARDRALRRRAADYLVYLVLRTVGLSAPVVAVPVASAAQFLTGLQDADTGTNDWIVDAPWPDPARTRRVRRRGGSARKVLAWAFERQGLFAANDLPTGVTGTPEVREGPGSPPGADLYIPGRGPRADGGYAPVPLRWNDDDWLADPAAVQWDAATTRLAVQVRNRGRQPSSTGTLRVWVALSSVTGLPGPAWTSLGAATVAPISTGGLAPVYVTPTSPMPRGVRWVLVEVSCPEDRADSDPASMQPCAAGWPAVGRRTLRDMVSGDNNLALARVDFG